MKDLCLDGRNLDKLVTMVIDEHLRQLDKWGVQNHDACEWLTITAEEFGEMAKAMLEYHFQNTRPDLVVKEAIQTATLCLKIAEMFQAEVEKVEK